MGKKHSITLKYLLILLLPLGFILNYISSGNENITEKVYSNSVYKGLSQVLSRITGVFPFSVAEIFLILLILFAAWRLAVLFVRLVGKKVDRLLIIKNFIINAIAFAGAVYFFFIILWGLNYNRMPVSHVFELEVSPASIEELVGMTRNLIAEINEIRGKIPENSNGVMYLENGYKDVFKRAEKGYKAIGKLYKQFRGKYGLPKPVLMSELMSYSGILGVYVPFTAEANINTNTPSSLLPVTTCHEMAHQRGFAREDEANYIAYATCRVHPDADFQYSGLLQALINSLNAVYRNSPDIYKNLVRELDDGVIRDIEEINRFNRTYEGWFQNASQKVNDVYLKANNQKDGEKSYGRVVDLLIAEYRMKKNQKALN